MIGRPARETSSWRPGTLRPYESFSSLGAKYSYLNRITPFKFSLMLHDYLPEGGRFNDPFNALDTPFFDVSGFAKLLDESRPLLSSSMLSKIELDKLESCTGYNLNTKSTLAYCPACITQGYHSIFHQLHDFEHCFIHGLELIKVSPSNKRIPNATSDIRLIIDLYALWFEKNSLWDKAKLARWDLLDSRLVKRKGTDFLAGFKALNSRLDSLSSDSFRFFSQSTKSTLRLATKIFGEKRYSFENLGMLSRLNTRSLEIGCSITQAEEIMATTSADLAVLMHARQIECLALNQISGHTIKLSKLLTKLLLQHRPCLHAYKRSIEELELTRPSVLRSISGPYSMVNYSKVPCNRILTLNLFEKMLDVEDENIISGAGVRDLNPSLNAPLNLDSLEKFDLCHIFKGTIPREQHLIMRNYKIKSNSRMTNFPPHRMVSLIAPKGPFAELIDALLERLIHSWIWALYITEENADNLNTFSKSPYDFFEQELYKLTPAFLLTKSAKGLTLHIGDCGPRTSPPWDRSLLAKAHKQKVREETKKLQSFLENQQVLSLDVVRSLSYKNSAGY